MKKYFFFALLFSWLLLTLVVDIVALPTIFRVSNQPALAGKIGMAFFSTFNSLEVMIAGALFFLRPKDRLQLPLVLSLVGMALLYRLFMTPQITHYGTLMHQGVLESATIHASYHRLYKTLEFVKMLLILVGMGRFLKGERR